MDKHFRLASMAAELLDSRFKIAGFKFGIDPLLGFIPGLGDAVGLILSFYIVWIAMRMKIPENKIQRMITNVIFDFLIGLFPVVGDFADFAFKANSRNLEILKEFAPGNIIEMNSA